MATKTYTYELTSAVSQTTKDDDVYFYISLNTPLTELKNQIPAYSKITSAKFTTYVQIVDATSTSNWIEVNASLTNSDGSTVYLDTFATIPRDDHITAKTFATEQSLVYSGASSWFNSENANSGNLIYAGGVNTYLKCHIYFYSWINHEFRVRYKLEVTYEEPHTHSYTSVVTAPTCTTAGYTTYTCSCGDSYTGNATSALGHTGGTANCVDKAVCTRCGTAYGSVDSTNHKTLTTLAAVAATCTTTGLTEGKKCTACGVTTQAQQTVAALGHTSVIIPAVAPTLTETGLTEGAKCSVCGIILTAQQIVPATGAFNIYKGVKLQMVYKGTNGLGALAVYKGTTKIYG